MKLFGTVIAVLFHPGSASKINGKNLGTKTHILNSAETLGKLRRLILFPSETSTCMFLPRSFLFIF